MTDLAPIACALFLIAAFVLAGVAQTAWLGSRTSRRFAVPLDGARTFRGRRIFGDNKTARGFLVMVPAAGAAFCLLARLVETSGSLTRGSTGVNRWSTAEAESSGRPVPNERRDK